MQIVVDLITSLKNSPWETLLFLTALLVFMVILPMLLLTFVKSLIQGKSSIKTLQNYLKLLEPCLETLLTSLKSLSKTEQPNGSLETTSDQIQPQQEQLQEPSPEEPPLLELLQKAVQIISKE